MKYINLSVPERKYANSGDFNLTAQKIDKSKYPGKFLMLLAKKRRFRKTKYEEALKLYSKKGKSLKEISKITNIDYLTLFRWLKYKQPARVQQHGILYDKWLSGL